MVTRLPPADSPPLATSSYQSLPIPKLDIVRNPSVRVRQAVRDNNVTLLSRLQHKTDLRNTDKNRLTSLSWAATEGNLEVFEWLLLDYGHDDQELSRDADNNTILHLLASVPSLSPFPYAHQFSSPGFPPRVNPLSHDEQSDISLRMTQVYHTLFPFLLDWSNSGGKTALHVAAQAGNYRFISLLCELGADLDLTDLQGNTPLHYSSAWGHLDSIRALLENGCGFSSRNFEGFTPSDFAYSDRTLNALQVIARDLFEERRTRKKEESRSVAIANSSGGSMINQSSNSIFEGNMPYRGLGQGQHYGYTQSQSQPLGVGRSQTQVQGQPLYQGSGSRGRSASLSASSMGGSSSVGGGGGVGGASGQGNSYSSQPGKYMDDHYRDREKQPVGGGGDSRSERPKQPPLPPVPTNHQHMPYPATSGGIDGTSSGGGANGYGERTSSLPMSRHGSSASASASTSAARAEGGGGAGGGSMHGSASNLSVPNTSSGQNSVRPTLIANASSSQRSNSATILATSPGPAAPQAVLGRPTPPLQPGNLQPPSQSQSRPQRITPNSTGGSGGGRPTPPLPHRSPSMPMSGEIPNSASLSRSAHSEMPLPIPNTSSHPSHSPFIGSDDSKTAGRSDVPKLPEGMMMGSVMRRANSAQAQVHAQGR